MDNKLYIISHRCCEDEYNEFPTFNTELLKDKISIYKQQRKENCISISVFEIDYGLIYRGGYDYDNDTEEIFEDCINMKNKYWDC